MSDPTIVEIEVSANPSIVEVAIAGPQGIPGIGALVVETVDTLPRTLTDGDLGKLLRCTVGGTVNVPAGLAADFYCGILQDHSTQVTIAEAVGVDLLEPDGFRKTQKRGVIVVVMALGQDDYLMAGRAGA